MFRPRVIAVAILAVSAVAAIFCFLPFQSSSLAQSVGPNAVIAETSPAQRSIFFGSATSRDNNFFLNSLLSIYKDRYVPDAPANSGHFVAAQSGGRRTGSASISSTRPSGISSGPAQKTLPGALGIIQKGGTIDPNIDSTPRQRQIKPEVVQMIGPVSQDQDLRELPYIAPKETDEIEPQLVRHPPSELAANNPLAAQMSSDPIKPYKAPAVAPSMPAPTQTFAGMTQAQACGSCLPPDTDGDVGPNNYIQSVNSSIEIFNKTGTAQSGPTTYNSFFSALGTSTPCGNGLNDGDGIAFYDHLADRWVVSDFAFPSGSAGPYYQCVGVSKTSNPVTGGWWLYAQQVDAANIKFLGDYPKFGMWPDGYYMAVNEFDLSQPAATQFQGVRVFAFNRAAMINGGSASTQAFSILPADLGDQYSFVPASFRTGARPPLGQPEWFMSINSSSVTGTSETQVFVRRFHVDFANPANSTFGVGASHTPDGIITVNGFVDAFTTTTQIVPNGTATTTQFVDTLGDKLMYPLIYQNVGGVESIWADQSVNNNQAGTGPVSVRWYQFNMTGNTIPATATQQQTFNNSADGLWRWMPSINVDNQGNMAIGYSTSSTTLNPEVRYAGRLAGDPLNNVGQGEATLTTSAGHQTNSNTSGGGRWGDYSTMFVDPTDGCTFYHTNEYYTVTSGAGWATRVGSFTIPGCVPPQQGTAHFTVTNCNSGALINGASVSIDGYPYGGTVANGTYDGQFLAPGSHTYSVTKLNNTTSTGNFSITNGNTTNVNPCIASGTAHFIVTDSATSLPLSGASVTVDGSAVGTTDASGFFDIDEPAASHTYQVSKTNYVTASGNFNTTLGVTTNVPVPLTGVAILGATKVADNSSVLAGQFVGYKVTISNTGTAAATGLGFSDLLPSGAGISWSIDAATSDAGFSITGFAPNQSITYSGTSLAIGASAKVHVTSATTAACVSSTSLNNTAIVTAGNATQAQASASVSVGCAPVSAGPVTITASAGTPGPTDYATLQAAFAAINAGTHQGAVNVWIFGNTTETGTAVLNASGSGSASYSSVLVAASGGARTITGAIAAGSPLVDLNGADNVTIDGQHVGGTTLTLSNTTASGTASTSTIRLINGAQNDTIKNSTILGSSTSSTATAGGAILISTSTGGANSGTVILNNDIGPAGANLPSKAIMSLGSASPNNNTGTTISGNNVFDFFTAGATCAGISIGNNTDLTTISGNHLFQSAPRTFTSSSRYNGILFSPGAAGSGTITGNVIGFGAFNATGTTTITGLGNTINGIQAPSTSTTVATSIQNNTISGFAQTSSAGTTAANSTFIAISVGNTAGLFNIGGITGNTIGSLDGSSTIVVNDTTVTANSWGAVGVFDFSFQDGEVISNNKIGAITINNGGTGTGAGFRGVRLAGTPGQGVTISNNQIGNSGAGAITDNVVGTYNMYGIDDASANLTCVGNTIRNMNGNANAAGFISQAGIILSAAPTGVSTISRNVVQSLTDNAGVNNGAIYAIYGNFPATANIVERNFVHSLSITSTNFTSQTAGILAVAGSATYKNNFVRLGVDSSGASITGGYTTYGIFDIAGTNNIYFNSVYIGGSGVVSSSNTFAFVSNVTTNTRNYLDNAFYNARSNASGTAKNYAITVAGTTPNPAGLTSNYNDLYVSGTGGVLGVFNATDAPDLPTWRTATGQDANSKSADPLFINPNGTSRPTGISTDSLGSLGVTLMSGEPDLQAPSAVVDLHITNPSPLRFAGITVAGVTNDFDGAPRPNSPDIGGDQFLGPTAARVGVSGRVLTNDGAGLRNATVVMRDASGNIRTAVTSAFGYYHFDDIEQGNYVMDVQARKFTYGTRVVNVNDELADLDFTPQQ